MLSFTAKTKDRNSSKALKKLFGSGKAEGRVGILSEEQHEGSNATVAEIGAVHEYGSPTQNIPRRSFLAATLNKHGKAYAKELDRITKAAIAVAEAEPKAADGALNALRKLMRGLAEKVRGDVVQTISSNVPPPLSPAYTTSKGDTITLIDTGQLRDSIAAEVRMGSEVVRSGQ